MQFVSSMQCNEETSFAILGMDSAFRGGLFCRCLMMQEVPCDSGEIAIYLVTQRLN